MIDWYDLGMRWRALLAGRQHGEVEPLLVWFAKEEGVAPNTIRRCASAAAVVERLVAADLLLDRRQLTSLPLKTLGALQRLERFGLDKLKPALNDILSHPGITGDEVLRIEANARTGSSGDLKPNRHIFRLRARHYREAVLSALGKQAQTRGDRLIATRDLDLFAPIVMDAVLVAPTSTTVTAVRVLPQGSPDTPDMFRRTDVLRGALAAARVFSSVMLVVEAKADVRDLTQMVSKFGSSGILLTAWSDDALQVVFDGTRNRAADLASHCSDRLDVFRDLPEDRRLCQRELKRRTGLLDREEYFKSNLSKDIVNGAD